MNLNQTFCASYCVNYDCKKMLSYSKVRAAEARGVELSHADLSKGCAEYKESKFEYGDKCQNQ